MKLRYETTECGRCLGSGEYSYNQRDGKRCWGCGGSGKVFTKLGSKAHTLVNELIDSLSMVEAQTFEVGDRIQFPGQRGYATLTEVTHLSAEESRFSSNGVAQPRVEFRYGSESLYGYNSPVDSKYRRPLTPAEQAQVVELARTLKAVTVVE